MQQIEKTEKPWYKKTWVVLLGIIIALWVIGNLSKKNSSDISSPNLQNESTSSPSESTQEKKWTEVYTFSGNGMKKSPSFELSGGDAKLVYKYKAPGGLGMGLFSVYVVDEGKDIMKTGGFPEVFTQAENEESESALQKSSGRYYLNVNASGSWKVSVFENK